jgi:hypothetical protein
LKNKKNPDSVASFLMELFSPEFWEYLATGRTIICSINVNTQFWLDVMYDKRLDGMNFKK